MAHNFMFWFIAVGLVLAVVLVGGGWVRMREQRRHVRAMLRDTFKRRRGQKGGRSELAARRSTQPISRASSGLQSSLRLLLAPTLSPASCQP